MSFPRPETNPEDAILAPKSLVGIAAGLGCGLAVVVALSAVDGTLRLTQGAHVVVAVLLGWWVRGRYEARQQAQQEASVVPPAPVPPVAVRPVRPASRLFGGWRS
jgi:hypothetical protein